jgi:hypothetical protein
VITDVGGQVAELKQQPGISRPLAERVPGARMAAAVKQPGAGEVGRRYVSGPSGARRTYSVAGGG